MEFKSAGFCKLIWEDFETSGGSADVGGKYHWRGSSSFWLCKIYRFNLSKGVDGEDIFFFFSSHRNQWHYLFAYSTLKIYHIIKVIHYILLFHFMRLNIESVLRHTFVPTQISAPPYHSQPCADRNLLVCTRFSAFKTNRKRNSFLMVHESNDSPLYYCLNPWRIFSTLPQHCT